MLMSQSKNYTKTNSKKEGIAHLEVSPPFSRGDVALRSTRNLETMRFLARSGHTPTPQNRLRLTCAFRTFSESLFGMGLGGLFGHLAKITHFRFLGCLRVCSPRYFYVFYSYRPFFTFLAFSIFFRGRDRSYLLEKI